MDVVRLRYSGKQNQQDAQRSESDPERVELRALIRSNNESNDPTTSYPYYTFQA